MRTTKNVFISFIFFQIIVSACLNDDLQQLQFKSSLTSFLTIPDSLSLDSAFTVYADSTQNLFPDFVETRNVPLSSIDVVKTDTLILTINSGGNFEFADSIQVFLSDGVEDIQLGELDSLTSSTEIALEEFETSFASILKSDTTFLKLKIFPKEVNPDTLQAQILLEMDVSGEL